MIYICMISVLHRSCLCCRDGLRSIMLILCIKVRFRSCLVLFFCYTDILKDLMFTAVSEFIQ